MRRRRHRTVFSQPAFWVWLFAVLGCAWAWYAVIEQVR